MSDRLSVTLWRLESVIGIGGDRHFLPKFSLSQIHGSAPDRRQYRATVRIALGRVRSGGLAATFPQASEPSVYLPKIMKVDWQQTKLLQ